MVDMDTLQQAQKAKEAEELEELSKQFLINKDEEETKLTLDFAKALLALDLEIKELNEEKKSIKKEAKLNGVAVQKVNAALVELKKLAKTNDSDLIELDLIEEVLGADVDVKTMVSELVRKER